ncbi:hypothetical protein HDV00_010672 [Rhizophlyctis rosea]|nr:hypothetical protein HDV00_010672 [Rhizophlyctis rosea]
MDTTSPEYSHWIHCGKCFIVRIVILFVAIVVVNIVAIFGGFGPNWENDYIAFAIENVFLIKVSSGLQYTQCPPSPSNASPANHTSQTTPASSTPETNHDTARHSKSATSGFQRLGNMVTNLQKHTHRNSKDMSAALTAPAGARAAEAGSRYWERYQHRPWFAAADGVNGERDSDFNAHVRDGWGSVGMDGVTPSGREGSHDGSRVGSLERGSGSISPRGDTLEHGSGSISPPGGTVERGSGSISPRLDNRLASYDESAGVGVERGSGNISPRRDTIYEDAYKRRHSLMVGALQHHSHHQQQQLAKGSEFEGGGMGSGVSRMWTGDADAGGASSKNGANNNGHAGNIDGNGNSNGGNRKGSPFNGFISREMGIVGAMQRKSLEQKRASSSLAGSEAGSTRGRVGSDGNLAEVEDGGVSRRASVESEVMDTMGDSRDGLRASVRSVTSVGD